YPFLSLPDQKNSLMPRYEGRWEAMGRRQTEAIQGGPRAYYLWPWENPRPEAPLESVTATATDRKFLVARSPLCHIDEPPFTRSGMTPVKITLPQEADAAKPFNLEVDVDRGVVSYPYALPVQSDAEFVADPHTGWGQAQNPNSSPAYVGISA